MSIINLFSSWWNLTTLAFCVIIPSLILWRWNKYERLLNYIPSFCTSVGIFMTFAILYDTLGTKISTADLSGKDSLKSIISELSNKFSCSLIGIFFSIAWSWIIRYQDGMRDSKLIEIKEWKQKDPLQLLWEIEKLQEKTIEISEQTIVFNQKNAKEISDRINNGTLYLSERLEELIRVQRGMDDSINDIRSAVNQSIRRAYEDFQNLLQQLIIKLGTQTLDIFGKNIEEIHKSLKDLTEQLLKTHQNSLDSGIKEIIKSITGLNPLLEKITGNFEQQTKEIQDSAKKNNDTIQEEFKKSTDKLLQQFNAIAINLNSTFIDINATFKQMGKDIQDSSQAILDGNLAKIQSTFDSLEEKQLRTKSFLEETTHRFSDAVEAFKNAQTSNESVLLKLQKQTDSLEQFQGLALGQLSVWESELEEIKKLREEVNDIANTVDQLHQLRVELGKINGRTN